MAQGRAHGYRRAARSRFRAHAFSSVPAHGGPGGSLGAYLRCPDARKSPSGAPPLRGVLPVTWLFDCLAGPFIDYGFMRRALAGSFALAFAAGPLGVFLVLRRMSLMGDAMAHAILPGVAVGFLTAGLSLTAMTIGGVVTGLVVALLAGAVARLTPQREDASFAALYLVSLGLGVLLVSLRVSNMDLIHVLFGSVLGLDNASLLLVASVSTFTLASLALIFRPLVLECLDPQFLRSQGTAGTVIHMVFLVLLVLTMV